MKRISLLNDAADRRAAHLGETKGSFLSGEGGFMTGMDHGVGVRIEQPQPQLLTTNRRITDLWLETLQFRLGGLARKTRWQLHADDQHERWNHWLNERGDGNNPVALKRQWP
jgi:hypothetical protein